jgi:hypothetical protein
MREKFQVAYVCVILRCQPGGHLDDGVKARDRAAPSGTNTVTEVECLAHPSASRLDLEDGTRALYPCWIIALIPDRAKQNAMLGLYTQALR